MQLLLVQRRKLRGLLQYLQFLLVSSCFSLIIKSVTSASFFLNNAIFLRNLMTNTSSKFLQQLGMQVDKLDRICVDILIMVFKRKIHRNKI